MGKFPLRSSKAWFTAFLGCWRVLVLSKILSSEYSPGQFIIKPLLVLMMLPNSIATLRKFGILIYSSDELSHWGIYPCVAPARFLILVRCFGYMASSRLFAIWVSEEHEQYMIAPLILPLLKPTCFFTSVGSVCPGASVVTCCVMTVCILWLP